MIIKRSYYLVRMLRRRFRCYLVLLRNILIVSLILFVIFIYQGIRSRKEHLVSEIPTSALKYALFEDKSKFHPMNTLNIRRLINEHNLQERILNTNTYGPIKTDTVTLVILVHKHTRYLKFLLMSLVQLKGIEDALLIFSHSYIDENVNEIIRNIDFCRVLQLFYPYSVQAYPHEFPGSQSNDCPYNMKITSAEAVNCTGAFSPDIHGRYRQPTNAEKKHHWWWTANKVFENLTCTEDHEGIVVFLEDDMYLMEDFIFMALYMKKIAESLEKCEFLSLGSKEFSYSDENDSYRVEVTNWDPLYHSSALVLDLPVWNTIVTHYDLFCRIDDYSWSRSLYYLSLNRRDGCRYRVMTSLVPRAFKITSKFYEKFVNFGLTENVYEVLDLQTRFRSFLFPPHLEVYTNIDLEDDDFVIFDYVESNGGWNDPRDKELCSNMTVSKIKKVLLDMKNEFEYNDGILNF